MDQSTILALWCPWSDPGLEHLRITKSKDAIVADGVIVRATSSAAFRVLYHITCNSNGQFRSVDLRLGTDSDKRLTLTTEGNGRWQDESGRAIAELEGCFEIDISATPFTNTLAIQRLQLEVGQSSELTAAYIKLPEMHVEAVPQRYTCLERGESRSAWKYEGLFRNFTAILPIDHNGLVIDYPETFRRVQ